MKPFLLGAFSGLALGTGYLGFTGQVLPAVFTGIVALYLLILRNTWHDDDSAGGA